MDSDEESHVLFEDSNPEEIKSTINEFVHLLEKSKNLFNGLREIPQYGARVWQPYFARTFEVYTKLWKFQQEHRQVLEQYYKLKRWQIGEIASKIGQIYYHYYLRTSEPNYLHEAFSFYAAVRTRAYYAKAKKLQSPDVMLKKLRYYTRFIVVCLLLRRMTLVSDLVKELNKQIKEYMSIYGITDREWTLVANEILLFVDNEQLLKVKDQFNRVMYLNSRISPETTIPLDKNTPVYLTLAEAIIIGNNGGAAVEYEPQEDLLSSRQADASVVINTPRPARPTSSKGLSTSQEQTSTKRTNPHKYLLYKPTFAQLYTYLSVSFKELPPATAMLVYFSCEPSYPLSKKDVEEPYFDLGGVAMNCTPKEGETNLRKKTGGHDMHSIHPGDLIPFTRKPLFLIIDSPTASQFKCMPKLFGQPLVALMAPQELPAAMSDLQHQGSLLTLFLFNPTIAFLYVCNLHEVPEELWVKCDAVVFKYLEECSKIFTKCKKLHHDYMQFYGDDFFRMILLRYCFCYTTLSLHRAFKGPSYLPATLPELPIQELLLDANLQTYISELASLLDTTALFLDTTK